MVVRSDVLGPRYAAAALNPLLTLLLMIYSHDKLRRKATAPTIYHNEGHRADKAWSRRPRMSLPVTGPTAAFSPQKSPCRNG